jgi:putative PEP-CTERM system TPR-repeat lipoprotein
MIFSANTAWRARQPTFLRRRQRKAEMKLNVLRLERASLIAAAAISFLLPLAASAGEADTYLQSAHQLEKANDLRGAEIQLRNAAQSEPANGAIRLELARIYLRLGNPNSAQAELFAAHSRGADDSVAAPLMAQAMLEMGEFGDLLKNVPAANRPANSESLVRTYRGMAQLALHDQNAAGTSFENAERLNPKSPLPLVGEARLFMAKHQFDRAEQTADRALKLDPWDSDALDLKAVILATRGNLDAAMQELGTALAANPHDARALLDRANFEMQKGSLDLAENDLQALKKAGSRSAMAVFLEASIDAQRGKYRDADAIFDRLRGAMSAFPPAYLVAAEVKLKLNQTGQSEDYIRKFLAQAGDQPKAYEMLGMIALKRGNRDSAIVSLEKALRLAPNDDIVMRLLGQAYMAHGDSDKARAMFDQAALKEPGNSAIVTQRALADFDLGDRETGLAELKSAFRQGDGNLAAGPPLILDALQSGRFDDAAQAAQELISRDPGNPSYQEFLALARIRQQNYAAAETLLRALLVKNPNLVSARDDLAQMYLQTHRVADAQKLYLERLTENASDVRSMEALADISFQENNDAEAMHWLSQAQAHSPTDPQPSLRMISILEVRKNWAEAIRRARELQAKFSKDPAVQDTLAHLYFESGNLSASLAMFGQAVNAFPSYAPLMAHYCVALAANKDYVKAADFAQRAIRLDPRSSDLKRAYVNLTYLGRGADASLLASESVFGNGPTAVLVAAEALDSGHNRPGAVAMLEKWQAQSPSGAVAARLGSFYLSENRPDKALALLEPWAVAHPSDIDARSVLAMAYTAAGNTGRAQAQYEWLAAQRSDDAVVLNNLAGLYQLKHDPRARQTAEKAMRIAPSSGSIADTLGWILFDEGDAAGAAKYLQLASAKMPRDPVIQYHYAMVLSKTGKPDQALAILHKLPDLKPDAGTLSAANALLASLRGGR